jgi:prepilin-type N-terminal cleavage/methylation domain-containing protein
MYRKNLSKEAFTLIELLVVISIIAVLMAIMMPALRQVREQAKSVICKTRLKDIGNTVSIYANDYPDKLPDSQWDYCRWMHKLAPYYEIASESDESYSTWGVYSWVIYRCPTQEKYAPTSEDGFTPGKGAGGIYGYNRYFTAEANAKYFMWRKFSQIQNAAGLPLFGDVSADLNKSLGQYGGGMHYGGTREIYPHHSAIDYGRPSYRNFYS